MKKLNRHNKLPFLIICISLFLGTLKLFPCTVAVVSGKVTADGRPLMWKNRDTSFVDNKILYFTGAKYSFIGLANASDTKGEEVWAGINREGFAIMNAQASDLARKSQDGNDNGRFMKLALGECANVEDFENLLKKTMGKYDLATSFGVIDAEGNAYFFETARSSFEKFDTRDPRVSPFGYIVRTNYAFTAPKKDGGGGYIRFERASHLFEEASAEGRLNLKFILQEAARDLVNEKLHSYPLRIPESFDPASPLYINTTDTINRNSTVSATVFHGASSRDKAYLATMWVILGQPISSVAVPLWVAASGVPQILGGTKTAPLNDLSKALVLYLYPDRRGHMPQYLNITRFRNYGGDGVLSRLFRIENEAMDKTEAMVKEWEKTKPSSQEMLDFEEKTAAWIYESLKRLFPDI